MPFKSKLKNREYQARWARNHRHLSAKRYRASLRDEINRIKEERGCEECGCPFPYYVLDFDHRPGVKKVEQISVLMKEASRAAVMAEIAKCDVVCANCHRERTFQRRTKC